MTRNAVDSRRLAFLALLEACRLWLGSATTGALADERLDWEVLERLAFVHNLEPLLHHLRAADRLGGVDVPLPLRERWERSYFENFVFNIRALEIIQPFSNACEQRKLPIAFIKGPVASARVFDDPALRIMVDLDVLCREEDLPDLIRAAREAGFRGGEQTAVHHVCLQHRDLNLPLELHFALYEFLPDRRELLAEVLRAAEPCRQGDDFVFPAPPSHVETVIEIAHLINHDLHVNLKPLLDLAGALRNLRSSTRLRSTLARWDLEPEAAILGGVLEGLFGFETVLGRNKVSTPGNPTIEAIMNQVETIDSRDRPALDELAHRPGFGAKLGYLRRLLMPSARRLKALSPEPGGSPAARRGAHILHTFRRGWGKLIRIGLAAADAPSVKREVFRRRK